MPYPLCRHILTKGLQCKSPALTDGLYCYFHARLYARHSPYRYPQNARAALTPGQHVELAALEDHESVQVALSVVVNALATGALEPPRAKVLLYGLSLAATNIHRRGFVSTPTNAVRTVHQTPEGLDLAQPGAVSTT